MWLSLPVVVVVLVGAPLRARVVAVGYAHALGQTLLLLLLLMTIERFAVPVMTSTDHVEPRMTTEQSYYRYRSHP